jgi:glycosyltransferase involved in cell wall biosynthesis
VLVTVTVVSHSAQLGGAELGLLRFLASQQPARYRVLLLEDGPLRSRIEALGMAVRIPGRPGARATLGFLRRELRGADGVVVSNTLRAATWVSLLRPRGGHAYYVQDLIDGGYFSTTKRLIAHHVALRGTDYVLANSAATVASLPPRARRLPTWVVYTPSGVDGAAGVPAREGRAPGPLDLLFLGRITPWKGVDVILDAWERLQAQAPDTVRSLTLCGGSFFGEDAYREAIGRRVASFGPAVRLLDHQDDIHRLLAEADVLVHASTTPEPFGQVIVQAMSAGALVVAPDAGGPREIVVDGESGLLFRPGAADSLAESLVAVAAMSREQRTAMASSATDRVLRFTDQQVNGLIAAALAEIELGRSASPGTVTDVE